MDLTCTMCCVRCTRAEFLTVIEPTGCSFRVHFQNSDKNNGGEKMYLFFCAKNRVRGHSPGLRYSCHFNAVRVLSQLPKIARSIVNTSALGFVNVRKWKTTNHVFVDRPVVRDRRSTHEINVRSITRTGHGIKKTLRTYWMIYFYYRRIVCTRIRL